jgi:dUTPase
VPRGMRIAQWVIAGVEGVACRAVVALPGTVGGGGGFGSTGR